MDHINLFQTNAEFNAAYNGSSYVEPWVSYTRESSGIAYNKESGPTPPPSPYLSMPLTIEITDGDGYITFNRSEVNYKINDNDWVLEDNPNISVSSGDTIQVKQDYHAPGDPGESGPGGDAQFFTTDGSLEYVMYGNIMSIYQEEGFENLDTFINEEYQVFYRLFYEHSGLTSCENLVLPVTALTDACYANMFAYCTSLTGAPALPAMILANSCYNYMFNNCESLVVAPVLPATGLAYSCYAGMFSVCESLTTAPVLPATSLTEGCYSMMFENCSSLVSAPVLPATTLAPMCYDRMFQGCTSLTTAPALPATALTDRCYTCMFWGCSDLTSAPELPATTLAEGCYSQMFVSCGSLNYVKCLATDISASYCTFQWFYDISSSGTFVKNSGITEQTWGRGDSGIPTNWTVEDAS